MDVNKFTLIDHLSELRKRLLIIVIAILITSCICYFFIEPLFESMITPADNKFDFIYISPPELFLAYIKISLVAGIIVTFPIILYEVWAFIKPGLEKRQRNSVIFALFGGVFFFLIGIIFCYKIVLPLVIQFFSGLSTKKICPMISVGSYISFVATTLLSFGIVFEMPMVIVVLSKLGIITPTFLKKNRKYITLLIFIFAAIITPPDVISQLLLAAPMLVLYEISIFFAKIIERKKRKKLSR